MIAVDTNLLVYAHRADSPWNKAADLCLTGLAEGNSPWAIPWPCLHDLAISTHPRIYQPPTPLAQALEQVEAWMESPSLILLHEMAGYWPILRRGVESGKLLGPRVHDAHVAALCVQHDVQELWSADRDFSRWPGLRVKNPLLPG